MNDSSTNDALEKVRKEGVKTDVREVEKTWTIRKVSPETIAQTKEAANRSGMKIGAWVERQLQQAIENPSILSSESHLATGIRKVANDLNGKPDDYSEEWRSKMEETMDKLIKGQHSLMIMVQDLKKIDSQ